jgi:hypothetical protein
MRAAKQRDSRVPKSSQSGLRLANRSAGAEAVAPASVRAAEGFASGTALPATFTARLVALDEQGQAWIGWQDDAAAGPWPSAGSDGAPNTGTQTGAARSTVALAVEHVGRDVLVCRANRAGEPVIVGVLTQPLASPSVNDPTIDLIVERRRVVFSAQTEVVLRCGEGSITLSADGKVTVRGVDVVSSAERTQRIRGGAVRIN